MISLLTYKTGKKPKILYSFIVTQQLLDSENTERGNTDRRELGSN